MRRQMSTVGNRMAESSGPVSPDVRALPDLPAPDAVRPYARKRTAPATFYAGTCGLIFQHPLPATSEMRAWADAEYATTGAHSGLRIGAAP